MRRDLFINGASSLSAVSPRDLGGRDRSALVSNLAGAVGAGLCLPLELVEP